MKNSEPLFLWVERNPSNHFDLGTIKSASLCCAEGAPHRQEHLALPVHRRVKADGIVDVELGSMGLTVVNLTEKGIQSALREATSHDDKPLVGPDINSILN